LRRLEGGRARSSRIETYLGRENEFFTYSDVLREAERGLYVLRRIEGGRMSLYVFRRIEKDLSLPPCLFVSPSLFISPSLCLCLSLPLSVSLSPSPFVSRVLIVSRVVALYCLLSGRVERWGAGVEYYFQEFNEPYAPS